ncbi:unnamed protein product [Adineta ricciae]|uniref:Protein THEM6 n=1 Tax=Adineta ricciae TaxID=249248 RepID=A0A813NJ04_ADIRI|nr:unnamed protein product [Adineta ricciae]CAF0865277.1 unnamed protein product [Adineta ricciae]
MLDFGYFLRMYFLANQSKGKKKDGDLFGDYIINGQCWLNDLDLYWHMNNSRYLRECDFGRTSLLIETGLWRAVVERRNTNMKDAGLLVSALQVQYRQSIELGDKFQIVTRLHGWDDRAFYFEQLIILEKNKQTAFSVLVRTALTPRDLTPQMLVDDLQRGSIQSPKFSPDVQIFADNYKLNLQPLKSKL